MDQKFTEEELKDRQKKGYSIPSFDHYLGILPISKEDEEDGN